MSNTLFKSIRGAFVAGVIVLAPLGITFIVFTWFVEKIGGRFREDFFFFLPDHLLTQTNLVIFWNFLATVVVLLFVTLLGYFSRYFIGRYIIRLTERILKNVPIINALYNTVRQIVDTFSSQNRAVFSKVVLIQFPRPGLYAIGFLTRIVKGESQERTEDELWNVFVPTTPNPTSGFLIMVPKSEIQEMDMTVGEGMKVIISGGAVVPAWDKETQKTVDTTVTVPEQTSVPTKQES
jgi:uncharacterized membrane protein